VNNDEISRINFSLKWWVFFVFLSETRLTPFLAEIESRRNKQRSMALMLK